MTWGEDVPHADVFDVRGVEFGLFADDGEEGDEEVVDLGVFEEALAGFLETSSCCVGDDLVMLVGWR